MWRRRVAGSVVRWAVVFAGATAGSLIGRVAAAFIYDEPVSPLLDLRPRHLLSQDVAPGFLTAELLGRALGGGPAAEAAAAALGAAASAIITGPRVAGEREVPNDRSI